MIIINFNNTFPLTETAADLSYVIFNSTDVKNRIMTLKVEISPLGDPHLPNVYNLAFGPMQEDGKINDSAKIHHQDRNRVFSTILFFALTFLQVNSKITIGLDGSNDIRAYLYHRMILLNREYLNNFFVVVGVDWFVRLFRDGTVESGEDGYPLFKPRPELFDYQRPARDLYRYYMFYLK